MSWSSLSKPSDTLRLQSTELTLQPNLHCDMPISAVSYYTRSAELNTPP